MSTSTKALKVAPKAFVCSHRSFVSFTSLQSAARSSVDVLQNAGRRCIVLVVRVVWVGSGRDVPRAGIGVPSRCQGDRQVTLLQLSGLPVPQPQTPQHQAQIHDFAERSSRRALYWLHSPKCATSFRTTFAYTPSTCPLLPPNSDDLHRSAQLVKSYCSDVLMTFTGAFGKHDGFGSLCGKVRGRLFALSPGHMFDSRSPVFQTSEVFIFWGLFFVVT